MEKDKLPPIPTPASQRWREFRIQVLPFVVFLSVLTGIVYLWRSYVQPVGIIGSVETNSVNVTSLSDGVISEVFVERFQNVTADQVIAIVANTDPDLIKAQMAVAQTELNLLRARMEIDQQRTAQGYQQLRVDLMVQQVARAIAEANLINANSNYLRTAELVRSNILSQADFDRAKAQRDALQSEVNERTAFMTDLRGTLTTMTNLVGGAAQDPINAAIDAKSRELDLMLKPSTLKAPISGMITIVHHVKGERILRGMPVVSISDPESRRIVGYIRQPVAEAHPDERNSTVLAGTLYVGFGETFDASKVVAVPTGGVYVAQANVAHYVWAKDGAVVYQEAGVGPTRTVPVKR